MTPEGNSRTAREQLSHKPSLRPLSASTAVETQSAAADDDIESISSLSSSSLGQRVSLEAQESSLITKVQCIQQEAKALREEIASGGGDVGHIQSTLDRMLQEHSHLATTVAMVATTLEDVNRQSKGRAAKYISTSHTSLGTELHLLAEHLKDLEEALQNDSNTSRLLSPPSPSPHSLSPTSPHSPSPTSPHSPSSPSPPHISVDHKPSPPLIRPDDRVSPRLPDIYLTPSRPHHSDISPLTHQSSITSCTSRSLASSLTPQLDPFTPDTSWTPAQPNIFHEEEEREMATLEGEVAENKEQILLHAVQSKVDSPRDSILRQDAGTRSVRGYKTNSSVLKWLSHQTSSYHPVPDHSDEREGTREEVDCRSDASPDGFLNDVLSDDECNGERVTRDHSEGVAAASDGLGGPLSPPVSSPCADSGISSSNLSHHPSSSLPPITHTHDLPPTSPDTPHPSPLPTITMSDIEALREELARLRQEILNPSRWGQALSHDTKATDTLSAPSTEATQPPAGVTGVSSSTPYVLDTPRPSTTLSVPKLERSYQFTPVSRPYHSVSRPFHTTSLSRHRRLFSNSGDSMYRDSHDSIPREQQSSIRTAPSRPKVVSQSTQTTPPSTPGAHFSTKSENRTRQDFTPRPYPLSSPASMSYTPSFITTLPSSHPLSTPTSKSYTPSFITTLPSSHPLSPSLPATFTPHLIVHTLHHHPPPATSDGDYQPLHNRTPAATPYYH